MRGTPALMNRRSVTERKVSSSLAKRTAARRPAGVEGPVSLRSSSVADPRSPNNRGKTSHRGSVQRLRIVVRTSHLSARTRTYGRRLSGTTTDRNIAGFREFEEACTVDPTAPRALPVRIFSDNSRAACAGSEFSARPLDARVTAESVPNVFKWIRRYWTPSRPAMRPSAQ